MKRLLLGGLSISILLTLLFSEQVGAIASSIILALPAPIVGLGFFICVGVGIAVIFAIAIAIAIVWILLRRR